MPVRRVAYAAPGWGVGELWLSDTRPVWHESPRPPGGKREDVSPLEGHREPLAERLAAFYAGEDVDFDDVELGVEWPTPFAARLAGALRDVPRGDVVTYGELAALAGRPGAARAAGTFCARNPLPVFVPCHRVVASDGIGGYGALGSEHKRRLLGLEGVAL